METEFATFGITLLKNLFISAVGILFYMLYKAIPHLSKFNMDKFWNENIVFWVWASLVQALYCLIMAAFPALDKLIAGEIIYYIKKAYYNQNVVIPVELVGTIVYLSLTWILSVLVYMYNKKVKKTKESEIEIESAKIASISSTQPSPNHEKNRRRNSDN